MEPLQVFACDEEMNRLTGAFDYLSLTWHRRYYEPGEFQLVIPSSVYSPEWRFIVAYGRVEVGIVNKVELDDSENPGPYGEDVLTVSGFFLEQCLNELVFLVEQTEQEEYRIPAPTRVSTRRPTVKQGADGTYYIEQKSFDGSVHYKNVETGTFDSHVDASTLTDVEVLNAPGTMAAGPGVADYRKSYYDSYSTDGETLVTVSPGGIEHTYEIVGKAQGNNYNYGGSTSGNVTLFKDEDGNIRWTTGVATSREDGQYTSYLRAMSEWERETEGLEKVTTIGGETYAIAYREVKGPWQLRTGVGDVGKEMDNVQQVIEWAQLIYGNSMLYDEPGFTGETKVIDPSLKRVGDLFYEELKTVEASVRLMYDFVDNTVVFSVWRGLDRTQGNGPAEGEEGEGNPWAVFSDAWGTLHDFRASTDDSNYRNTCYVLYDYYEPEWDDAGNPVVRSRSEFSEEGERTGTYYTVPQRRVRGFETVRLEDEQNDKETWLDLRDEAPEAADGLPDPSEESSEAPDLEGVTKAAWDAWRESIKERGRELLLNDYCVVSSLDSGTLSQDDYMSGWDLGDKVDLVVTKIGMYEQARITGVIETHEAGKSTVRPEIGEQQVTITKKARLN